MPRDLCRPDPTLRGAAREEATRSSRDPRLVWARLLPRTASFRHPYARFLAEWSDAILFMETFGAWQAAHPDVGDLPAELQS